MKTNFLNVLIFAVASMTFLPSCKDACKDVSCLNGGTCDDGNCTCASGYEGSNCISESRAKFFGNYVSSISVSCLGVPVGTETDTITVLTSATGINNIKVGSSEGEPFEGVLDGNNITFDNQPNPEGGTLSGTGTFSSTAPYVLTFNMTFSDGQNVCTATVTGTKL